MDELQVIAIIITIMTFIILWQNKIKNWGTKQRRSEPGPVEILHSGRIQLGAISVFLWRRSMAGKGGKKQNSVTAKVMCEDSLSCQKGHRPMPPWFSLMAEAVILFKEHSSDWWRRRNPEHTQEDFLDEWLDAKMFSARKFLAFFLQLPRFSFHFSVMWTNSCETSLRLSLMQEGITGHRPRMCLFPSVQNNGSPFWARSPHPANSLLSRLTGRWKSLQLNKLNCLCVEDTGLKKN